MHKKERTRCKIYSRVVGFITPIEQWNEGKRAEFGDRKLFKLFNKKSDKKKSKNKKEEYYENS